MLKKIRKGWLQISRAAQDWAYIMVGPHHQKFQNSFGWFEDLEMLFPLLEYQSPTPWHKAVQIKKKYGNVIWFPSTSGYRVSPPL
ncbi:MAG: hypothetical protein AAGJ95_14005 [Cyanobacteria bacterium J06554_11]